MQHTVLDSLLRSRHHKCTQTERHFVEATQKCQHKLAKQYNVHNTRFA